MSLQRRISRIALAAAATAFVASTALAGYQQVKPKMNLPAGAVAVTAPGSYAKAGTTYVLTEDVSSATSPIFLGKDVTLDLNGHTVTFADGKYERVPNSGFEDGLKHWDVSKAPGAQIRSTIERPMVGKKFLLLPEGQEIVSEYVNLPVADRSYYAMCAVSRYRGWEGRRATITVEDEKGKPVRCTFTGGSKPRVSCPLENGEPKLGGGVLFAHLHYLPAGKYRIRVKATRRDCQIDQVDIRPAFDTGVAVLAQVKPYATYADMLKWYPCEFFDYAKKNTTTPVDSVPVVKGAGTITIKNGVIKNGSVGARSFGIMSNAKDVTLKLENVKVLNAGINANAVFASKAVIKNCRFEVDTPFIINRHDTSQMNVQVAEAVEIAHSEFIGGQGSLSMRKGKADVHDNLFANGQTVTNHYSISPGSGDRIYRNRFEPQTGSGIYIGRVHDVELFDNVFKITAAPPNSEYRSGKYSTNAVRLSDYNAKPGGTGRKAGCYNNKVYRNKMYIYAKDYPEYKGYQPHAYAFFISVGGGTNKVFDNEIFIENKYPGTGTRAHAFFIGGSDNGGEIYNNKVTSNCTACWFGNSYGNAGTAHLYNNTFIKAPGTPGSVRPILLGNGGNHTKDIRFISNKFLGWTNLIKESSRTNAFSFGWTLRVKAPTGSEVTIVDGSGKEAFKGKTDGEGIATARLAEFRMSGGKKTDCSTYKVTVGGAENGVTLKRDTEITFR